jgi:hypothetical protein
MIIVIVTDQNDIYGWEVVDLNAWFVDTLWGA